MYLFYWTWEWPSRVSVSRAWICTEGGRERVVLLQLESIFSTQVHLLELIVKEGAQLCWKIQKRFQLQLHIIKQLRN